MLVVPSHRVSVESTGLPQRAAALLLTIAAVLALGSPASGEDLTDEVGPEDRAPILTVDADGFAGGTVGALAITDDGRFLAAADSAVVRVYDLRTKVLARTIRGFRDETGSGIGRVQALALSSDGRYVAMGVKDNSKRGSTRMFDVRDGSMTLLPGHTGCTQQVQLSPDGRLIATTGCDRHVFVHRWDPETETATQLLAVTRDTAGIVDLVDGGPVAGMLRFDSSGRYLVDGHQTGGVFEVPAFRAVQSRAELPLALAARLRGDEKLTHAGYQWSHKYTSVAAPLPTWGGYCYAKAIQRTDAGATAYRVGIWTSAGGEPVRLLEMAYHGTAVTLNAAAGLAAAADGRGVIYVWNLNTSRRIALFRTTGRSLWNVAWSDDGTALRFADRHHPAGTYNYNRFGGVTHRFDVNGLLLRKDGKNFPDREIRVRTAGKWIGTKQESSDTYQLATFASVEDGNDNGNVIGPLSRRELDDETNVRDFNFSLPEHYGRPMCYAVAAYPGSVGEHLFFGTDEGSLYEGRLEADSSNRTFFRLVRSFIGHGSFITALSVSPDRRHLASSSLDGTLRVWSLTPPRTLGDLDLRMSGTRVAELPSGGEAYKAGVRKRYLLARFGETSYYGRFRDLMAGQYHPGDRVEIAYRNGDTRTVTLAASPDYAVPLWNLFLTRPDPDAVGDGEWVAWTTDGYYAASTEGARHVGWHVNEGRDEPARFYTVDQFGDRMHDRQIVIETLRRGSSRAAASAVAAELDRPAPPRPVDADSYDSFRKTLPPTVLGLTVDRADPSAPTAAVTFTVRRPDAVPLREVQVWVDGRLTPGRPEGITVGREDGAAVSRFRHDVALSADARIVKVAVEDTGGLRDFAEHRFDADDTRTAWVTVRKLPAPVAAPADVDRRPAAAVPAPAADVPAVRFGRDLHILAIGISRYDDEDFRLEFAHRDATEFAAFWRGQEGRAFDKVVCRTLTDAAATREAIEDGLFDLSERAGEEDLAMVFLSGHGLLDGRGVWHFATTACDPARLDRTGLAESRFEYYFDMVHAGNLLLLSDTCHAAAYNTGRRAKGRPVRRVPLWDGRGRVSIASCQPEEQSFERADWRDGHGAFTAAVLDFLEDGAVRDDNRDGWLNLSEMQTHVTSRVRGLTGGDQNPGFNIPSNVGNPRLLPVGP